MTTAWHAVGWRSVRDSGDAGGELGPLEGSMKPLTLMASEDGDGEAENWQQRTRSCGDGDRHR